MSGSSRYVRAVMERCWSEGFDEDVITEDIEWADAKYQAAQKAVDEANALLTEENQVQTIQVPLPI